MQPHPVTDNQAVKILSCVQIGDRFPLFLFFATNAQNARESYRRYLANKIYETYDFDGCPVVIEFKKLDKKRARTRNDNDEVVNRVGDQA